MTPQLVYHRWMEMDPPEGCEKVSPMASWVLPLADKSALVTFLYRPLTFPKSPPRTRILLVSPLGNGQPWPPAQDYPAPVMFYGHGEDLYGLDLTMPGKVYVCDCLGKHIATLEMDIRMDSILAPQSLQHADGRLHWTNKSGQHVSARCEGELRDQRVESQPPPEKRDVHFPHTHVCGDGCLYVLDFDPMARMSKFQLI